MTSFFRVAALGCALIASGASAHAAPATTIQLPSGKSISCDQAKKYLGASYQPGLLILLPKDQQDAQARRAAITAETIKHIDDLKKEWSKQQAAQRKKMRDSFYWYIASLAVKLGSAKALKSSNLSEIDKKYAEVAAEKSQQSAELVVKAGFKKEISKEEVAVMPAGSILTILSTAGKVSGWWGYVLDGGMFGIEMASLYGDAYLTDEQFGAQIAQLDKLALTLAERITQNNKAAVDAFKKQIDDKCK